MKSTNDSGAGTTTTSVHKFRNRDNTESQVCQAFAALGTLAGVDVDQGKGPDDMDPKLVEAAYQSNFDDPHFLGGPFCFHYATTAEKVDTLAAKANAVTEAFAVYIHARGSADTIQKAEGHIALIHAAIAWLRKTRRSP
jgi:hypothetical protein